MAFHKIDESAVVKDQSLDTGLLQDIQDQARAAQQARGQACAWVADYRNPPRLAAYERHALPFIIKLPPRATNLRAKVRLVGDGSIGGTLGIAGASLEWLERPVPADADTASVTSSTEASRELDLDVSALEGEVLVWLTWKSNEGTPAEIAASSGGAVDGHLTQIRACDLVFENASTQFGDEIPAAAVEVRTYTPPSASSTAAWSSESLSRRQVIRAIDDTTDGHLFFYPPWANPGAARSTGGAFAVVDAAWWIPLGWVKIYSVEFQVTALGALSSAGTTLNATAPPVAQQGQRIYQEAEAVWAEHGRWHHLGPQSDPDLQDLSDSAKGWWGASTSPPVSPVHAMLQLEGTGWEDVGRCVVNRDSEFTDVDGSALTRTGVEAVGLVALSTIDEPLTFEITARLQAVTMATLATTATGTEAGQLVQSVPFVRATPDREPVGWALAGTGLADGNQAFNAVPRLHALRGLYDCARWGEYRWRIVRASLIDQLTAAPGRRLSLQIDQVDETADGERPSATSAARYLHLATWSAWAVAGIDSGAMGAS